LSILSLLFYSYVFFFSSRRRHTRSLRDWSSDVCSSDLGGIPFFRVDDRLESWIDTQRFTSLRVSQHTNEGRYHRERHVEFFPERSEERRVGKECRARGSQYHDKKQITKSRLVCESDETK